jgi:hypothetical protein
MFIIGAQDPRLRLKSQGHNYYFCKGAQDPRLRLKSQG